MDRRNKTHCDRCNAEVGKGFGIYAIGGFYHRDSCWEEEKQELIKQYKWHEHKTSLEHEMICPYCGYEQRDSWEIPGDDGTVECGRCEKEFDFTRNVEVTFSTTPLAKEDKA